MNAKYIIGIDGGSQSTKVFIFNEKGKALVSASGPLKSTISRNQGWAEHPDDDLWTSLKAVSKQVMSEFSGDCKNIAGIGLCSIRCCRVFMKKNGMLADPVMNWMDVRSYEKYIDREDIAHTCPPTGYLTYRLTAKYNDTSANAFQWQFPIDMETWAWSKDPQHFADFNIPKEKLFHLQMPGTILGYITKKAAKETSFPEGVPVVATANDKAVEALGSGLIEADTGLISLGTYIASMVCGTKYEAAPANYWTNLACIPNRYLYESNGIRRGMWLISWYKSIIGEEYAKKAAAESCSAEDYLEREAAKIPAGSEGLISIPDWLAPASQLYRKGLIIGFDNRHTRGHIYKSLLEGIAMTLKNNWDDMINELGIVPDKIIVAGGGSNSNMYMQILADMYGVKTVRNKINGAASLGSAICAAVAAGIYKNFDEAVHNMVHVKDEFIPNANNHKKYDRINSGIYRKLPHMLEETLKTAFEVCSQ